MNDASYSSMCHVRDFNGTVIVDIDGCLSDDTKRRKFLPERNDNPQEPGAIAGSYEKYHDGMINDPIIESSLDVLRVAVDSGKYILFLTARPVKFRNETTAWIKDNVWCKGRTVEWCLHMRADDDLRSSVEYKREVVRNWIGVGHTVVAAYDDRPDIVAMYRLEGILAWVMDKFGVHTPDESFHLPDNEGRFIRGYDKDERTIKTSPDAGDVLIGMGETFKERNAVYKDNSVLVGEIMALMFPEGVKLKTAADFEMWHLFELKIVKLTRFAKSGLTHKDSIHDDAVYSAMCELLVGAHSIKFN